MMRRGVRAAGEPNFDRAELTDHERSVSSSSESALSGRRFGAGVRQRDGVRDMSRELSPEQRRELLALLQRELRVAYEASLANGVDEATLVETINERRQQLQSEES
jgi:hypothetical protein